MKTRNKKGFTIVELVIVIAVIGILTAILVPVFINLTNKANRASDDSLVKNLNTAMAMEEGEGKKNSTYNDAIEYLDNYGFKLANLATKSEYSLLWNSKTNRFLLNEESEYAADKAATGAKAVDYWSIKDNIPEGNEFSIYAGLGWDDTAAVELTGIGFDAGNHPISSISYNGASQNVVIRTNSYSTVLTIDAENDTVTHYGKANKIDITAVDNNNCYNEHGDITGNINLEKGKVVVHKDCSAGAVVINMTAAELATVTTLSADNSANKEVPIILNTSEVLWGANPNNGLINPTTNNIIYSSTGGTLPENFDTMTDEQKEAAIATASEELVQGVAAIKNANYATLQEAVEAAVDGDTIVLLDNINLSKNVGLLINKTITLNMNEKTITGNSDPLFVIGANVLSYTASDSSLTHTGHLTIRGNGSILNSNWDTITIYADAEVEIFDGTYSSQKITIFNNGGKLNIRGGNYTCTDGGTSYLVQLKNGASANIYSGNFTTGSNNGCYGVFMDKASTLNLGAVGEEGPNFNTFRPCVATNGSLTGSCTINIYSGTYRATRNNTTIDDQTVIQIANASNEAQALNIYGGYFEQTSHLENSCIFTLKYSGIINMNISGGTFNTGNSKYFCGYGTSGSGYPSTSNIRVNVQNNAIPKNVTVEVYTSISNVFTHLPERDFVVNQ